MVEGREHWAEVKSGWRDGVQMHESSFQKYYLLGIFSPLSDFLLPIHFAYHQIGHSFKKHVLIASYVQGTLLRS